MPELSELSAKAFHEDLRATLSDGFGEYVLDKTDNGGCDGQAEKRNVPWVLEIHAPSIEQARQTGNAYEDEANTCGPASQPEYGIGFGDPAMAGDARHRGRNVRSYLRVAVRGVEPDADASWRVGKRGSEAGKGNPNARRRSVLCGRPTSHTAARPVARRPRGDDARLVWRRIESGGGR
ncbi:hypothetical protein C8R44DRAFT_749196 [Mycena epipterygia]|nr:hypothetical protein C8R44DRAFT_749196 [Mycena epipterygia]